MSTSIIISTYNGAHKIQQLLDALSKQIFNNFEIVVVVDGSTDNTLEVLHRYKSDFDSIQIIEQVNAGRSKVKNRGAREAKGNLLIFFDDDMIPSPDSVKMHYEFHSQNNESVLAGNQTETIESQKTDIQNYKAWLTKKWTAKYTQDITQLSFNNLFFTAANCSIPRKIFEQLNGFDERLTDAEDFDLATRALQAGVPVFFDKGNLAIHNDPITCSSYIRRMRQYQLAHIKLIELHPDRINFERPIGLGKGLVYLIFSSSLFVFFIDHFNVFKILPKKIRYELYGIILYSLSKIHSDIHV